MEQKQIDDLKKSYNDIIKDQNLPADFRARFDGFFAELQKLVKKPAVAEAAPVKPNP